MLTKATFVSLSVRSTATLPASGLRPCLVHHSLARVRGMLWPARFAGIDSAMYATPSSKTTGTTTVGWVAASPDVEIRAVRAMASLLVMIFYGAVVRALGEAGHCPHEVTQP